MFNFSKKPTKKELTEQELVDKELKLYKNQKILEIDVMVQDYKKKRTDEMLQLSLLCNQQTGEHEHVFHNRKEVLGIEIAKLEARLEYLERETQNITQKLLRN